MAKIVLKEVLFKESTIAVNDTDKALIVTEFHEHYLHCTTDRIDTAS